jgi:hypothetical protein
MYEQWQQQQWNVMSSQLPNNTDNSSTDTKATSNGAVDTPPIPSDSTKSNLDHDFILSRFLFLKVSYFRCTNSSSTSSHLNLDKSI